MQQVLYGALWVGAASQKVLMDCLSHNTIPNLEAGLFHRAAIKLCCFVCDDKKTVRISDFELFFNLTTNPTDQHP